jgi:hypothetical protein
MKNLRFILSLIFAGAFVFSTYAQDIGYIGKIEKEAVIYPNPLAGEKFLIKSESGIKKVEIVNMIGKVINRTENVNLELQEIQVYIGKCEKGMYFVKVTFEDNISIIKKLLVK